MKAYKNLFLFAAIWFALFFVTEFLLNFIFKDETPFWKLLAVSLVSAVVIAYPFLKKGKGFTLDHVKKKQRRRITLSKEASNNELLQNIEEVLKASYFHFKSVGAAQITFRSKMRLSTFGEKYKIQITDDAILIESLPAIYTIPIDGGQVYNEINEIEKKLKALQF